MVGVPHTLGHFKVCNVYVARNGDENKVLGHTSSLSFVLGAATVGDYTCRVTVTGYKEISSEAR